MCEKCDKELEQAQADFEEMQSNTPRSGRVEGKIVGAPAPPTPVVGTGRFTIDVEVTQTKVIGHLTDEKDGSTQKIVFQYHPDYTRNASDLKQKGVKQDARDYGVSSIGSRVAESIRQSCRERD